MGSAIDHIAPQRKDAKSRENQPDLDRGAGVEAESELTPANYTIRDTPVDINSLCRLVLI